MHQSKRGFVLWQRIDLLLVEVTDHQFRADGEFAAQRCQLGGQCLDQGGFAGTVRAEQAKPAFRANGKSHIAENGGISITALHLDQIKHRVGQLQWFRKAETETVFGVGRSNQLEPGQCL